MAAAGIGQIRVLSALAVLIVLLAPRPGVAGMDEAALAFEQGDYELALREWLPYAAQGNSEALYNLGQLYRQGLGVDRDLARAETYYLRAAQRDHVLAQSNLGTLLYFKQPSPDYRGAVTWWRSAARADEPHALYMLGVALLNGEFVAQDVAKGYAFLTLAAVGGIEPAAQARRAIHGRLDPGIRAAGEAMARQINPEADLSALSPAPESPVATVAATTPVETAPPAPPAEPGGYLIQLGAMASEDGARASWDRLVARHGDLLGDLDIDIELLDRGPGKSPLFRIRAGSFQSAAGARQQCDALKQREVSCFVVESGL